MSVHGDSGLNQVLPSRASEMIRDALEHVHICSVRRMLLACDWLRCMVRDRIDGWKILTPPRSDMVIPPLALPCQSGQLVRFWFW